jgi:tetratricopeptide (TPR) repeat protein/CHAT domain-containing protein
MSAARWWLGVLLCLALWSAPALAQSDSWESQNSAGEAAYQRGDYAEAEQHFAAALEIAEEFGADDPRVATSLNNQAVLYQTQGRYADAEPLFRRALAIREKVLGPEHPHVATSLNNLALLYHHQSRYAEAEPLFKRALVIWEKALGPEHPDVATSLNNLALLYHAQGRYAEAEPLWKRALAIREKALGPEHPDVATSLSSLAGLYYAQGRYAEAEPLWKRALAIREKALGPEHPDVATSLNNLALLYHAQGRYAEAEPLYKRALAIWEKVLGPEHPDVANSLSNLAALYADQGRHGEAEPLWKRALAIREKALGPEHPDVANSLNNLAGLYRAQGRYAEAEPLYKRALAIREKALGPEHPDVGTSLNNLGELYRAQGRYAEAEPLYKRALATGEKLLGPEHPDVATSLNNLAALYWAGGRYAEAEPLFKRALVISEKALGPEHPDVATSLNNLALLYHAQGRYAEAEPLWKRALAIREKALGPEHSDVAQSLNNLAALYADQGRYAEAEPLSKRALAIREKALGPEHSDVANSLNNLAGLYQAQGRYAEAEPLYKRALAIWEKALGPEHPDVAQSLNNLAGLYYSQGRYAEALPPIRRAARIHSARFAAGGSESELRKARDAFLLYLAVARAVMEAQPEQRQALISETLEAMQLSRASSVATAVGQMAARFAAGSDALAAAVRERQGAAARWRALDARLIAAAAEPPEKRNTRAEAADRTELNELGATIARLDERLARDFPAYTEIASPRPVAMDELRALLHPDEALLAYAVWTDKTYVFAVRGDRAELFEVAVGAEALREAVAELRASLTPEGIRTAEQLRKRGFPATRAYELYAKLFAPADKVLQGTRHVFVVPDDALQSLPLGVLLTEEPQGPFVDFSGYAQAPWLARQYAMSVLPSISSLRALRQFAGTAKADVPFRGVGNPKLGTPGSHRGLLLAQLYRGALADRAALLELPSLPETEVELEDMAKSLGVDATTLLTGEKATEGAVKKGALAKARVVTFATHAAVTGQIAGLAEPALVLTPPAGPSELDDGLLTASEVAHDVKLDADWVVLSACNTAATDGTPGAEGLSGLAKAFFYAGARALLVSHWAVESHASVLLTTGAFKALAESPEIGRAEALRRSMLAMLADKTHPLYAHPMFWAPFVLVGEGGVAAGEMGRAHPD